MRKYRIITKTNPFSYASEHYKKLRTNIDFLAIDKDYTVMNITSTIPEEGKTLTCLNLATTYAQNNKKILVIDMELRHPKVHRALDIPNNIGLSTCFNEQSSEWKKSVQKVDEFMDVLTTGPKFPFPTELLSSGKMQELIAEAKGMYDKIIIDTPPVSIFADAKIISNLADGTIFVIAYRKAKIDHIKNALKELSENQIDIIGTVFTQVPNKEIKYGKEYYYKKYNS